MSKAEIFISGNVTDVPRLNRTHSGSPVTNFRLASTKRRFDQSTQAWVDASTFYVDIECFGELGAHVARSIVKGDPVVVVGDIYSTEWESEAGKRTGVRVRADSVGPDLSRGWTTFTKAPKAQVPAAVESAPDDLTGLDTDYDLDADQAPATQSELAGAPF